MKKAIVIGGGSGIGLEVARTLKNNDYDVTCVGRKDRLRFEFPYVKCDVLDSINLEKLFSNNDFDVLVYTAGVISSGEESFDYNEDEINYIVDINLKGCMKCNQLFIDNLVKNNKSGKIVNISSISNKGSKYFPIYASTKAGIVTYTKSIASRYENIRVNVVSPGVIKTDMSYHETPEFDKYVPDIIENTPAKRLGCPADIANAVEFLLSDKAEFITGAEIVVDGGYTLPKE